MSFASALVGALLVGPLGRYAGVRRVAGAEVYTEVGSVLAPSIWYAGGALVGAIPGCWIALRVLEYSHAAMTAGALLLLLGLLFALLAVGAALLSVAAREDSIFLRALLVTPLVMALLARASVLKPATR